MKTLPLPAASPTPCQKARKAKGLAGEACAVEVQIARNFADVSIFYVRVDLPGRRHVGLDEAPGMADIIQKIGGVVVNKKWGGPWGMLLICGVVCCRAALACVAGLCFGVLLGFAAVCCFPATPINAPQHNPSAQPSTAWQHTCTTQEQLCTTQQGH